MDQIDNQFISTRKGRAQTMAVESEKNFGRKIPKKKRTFGESASIETRDASEEISSFDKRKLYEK